MALQKLSANQNIYMIKKYVYERFLKQDFPRILQFPMIFPWFSIFSNDYPRNLPYFSGFPSSKCGFQAQATGTWGLRWNSTRQLLSWIWDKYINVTSNYIYFFLYIDYYIILIILYCIVLYYMIWYYINIIYNNNIIYSIFSCHTFYYICNGLLYIYVCYIYIYK